MKPVSYDRKSLNKAYNNDNGIYVDKNTMYIAGTRDIQNDVFQWPLIPLNMVPRSHIYKRADEILKMYPEVKNIVGHSYGGAAALELAKQYPGRYRTRTYAAPVMSFSSSDNRYGYRGDPVSSFDWGRQSLGFSLNPHGY
jgi:hypothetical protein